MKRSHGSKTVGYSVRSAKKLPQLSWKNSQLRSVLELPHKFRCSHSLLEVSCPKGLQVMGTCHVLHETVFSGSGNEKYTFLLTESARLDQIRVDLFVLYNLKLICFKCFVACQSLVVLHFFISVRCSIIPFRGDGFAIPPEVADKNRTTSSMARS